MPNTFHIVYDLFSSCFKSRVELQLKNIALRHQLNVLRRSTPKRPRLRCLDPAIFATHYRLWPKIVGAISIIGPKTVIG